MNRSILIVICDFLLVSLLVFSTPDISKVSDPGAQHTVKMDLVATNLAEGGKDLAAVMRLALDDERKNRERLLGELNQTRETASQQQRLLAERQQQVQTVQRELQSRQDDSRRLEEQRSDLERQYAAARTNIQALNQQLQSSSTEASLSKERLAATEAEAKKQADQAAALQQQLDRLEKSNQIVLAEQQRLAGQLQVAEVERRNATEQVAQMREEVKVQREERAKLAEGVKALASKSGELAQEVRENRPLAPNTIFNEFVTNRVQARFFATRSGILGIDASRRKESDTVLVTDGTHIFALCHVQDTPLTLFNPGTDWEGLTGTLGRNTAVFPIRSLSFLLQDPRLVLMPVTETEARALGGRVYRISSDPFKFQDAVLVGTRDSYYGQCRFQIDLTTPEYVKLDNNFLKGLFGKFNPSRGDLVFSMTGELLGVMANSTYCMVIRNFDASATFQFGQDVRDQHTGDTLARLYSVVFRMPLRLQ